MQKGLWNSPLTSADISGGSISFEDICVLENGVIWTESRPQNQGRYAVVRAQDDQSPQTIIESVSIKSRVHEYGGGSISCYHNILYFINDTEKSLCRMPCDSCQIQTLVAISNLYFSEIVMHPSGSFLYVIGEDSSDPSLIINAIYKVDLCNLSCHTIAHGHDFFSSPQISQDGKTLAFISWDFPHMPWDESVLWKADIRIDGSLSNIEKLAGGADESVCLPLWSARGELFYISDKTGFWNLYQWDQGRIRVLHAMSADCAYPQWKLGRYSYAQVELGGELGLICAYTDQGVDRLGIIGVDRPFFQDLLCPYQSITHVVCLDQKNVYFFGASPVSPKALIRFNIETQRYHTIKSSMTVTLPIEWISIPERIIFASGKDLQRESFAVYYPPINLFVTVDNTPPPMIVRAHGGPTAHSSCVFSIEIQFWTTRGFAVLDVNYGGSSGFGRQYRNRLVGNWGVVDVQDCILAAQEMVKRGRAHQDQIVIRGSSSGGLTALIAVCVSKVFAAATSYYGVVDLEGLALGSHKFERYYLDGLIGPYPAAKAIYIERSPLCNSSHISCPILLFHGKEDKVVPLSGSTRIFDVLQDKGIFTKLLGFEKEGHGFRAASTIEEALNEELAFYRKVLGLV